MIFFLYEDYIQSFSRHISFFGAGRSCLGNMKLFVTGFSLIYEVRTHIRTIVNLLESYRLVSDFANQFSYASQASGVERRANVCTGKDEILIGRVGSPTRIRGQVRIFQTPLRCLRPTKELRWQTRERGIYNAMLNCCP